MRMLRYVLATATLAATAAAQAPRSNKVDSATLVSHAESLLKQQKGEDAVLVLWRALDQLAAQPASATTDATTAAARALLQANDPCDAQRRVTFTAVAKQQVALAAAYRGKKWFDTAAGQLDVADRYDRDTAAKERTALDASQKGAKEASEKRATPSPLLTRKMMRCSFGTWREVGECLVAPSYEKGTPMHEWITMAAHQDHQIVVEFRPAGEDESHDAGLWVGYFGQGESGAGLSIVASYEPETKEYVFAIMERLAATWTQRTGVRLPASRPPDGFHRLVVQVAREGVSASLDGAPAIAHKADTAIRGNVGLSVGTGKSDSCAVHFRNLAVEPLPRERSVDDKTRTPDQAAQSAGDYALEDARELLAKKQPEPAAHLLRSALSQVASMTAGEPRTKLLKAIDQALAQADPLAPKAKKAAQTSASELVKAADAYASAGLPRAALVLVEGAATFDPDGQAARLTSAREVAGK